jgi:hypothetical protein
MTTSRSDLATGFCYNSLQNDLDSYAVAYASATLLNNLFRGKEPFRQQACSDLLEFVFSLRRTTEGYATFSEGVPVRHQRLETVLRLSLACVCLHQHMRRAC